MRVHCAKFSFYQCQFCKISRHPLSSFKIIKVKLDRRSLTAVNSLCKPSHYPDLFSYLTLVHIMDSFFVLPQHSLSQYNHCRLHSLAVNVLSPTFTHLTKHTRTQKKLHVIHKDKNSMYRHLHLILSSARVG